MATGAETSVVYAAGAVQGIVLVTFPAASTIFTDPDRYDLSNTQYGVLFSSSSRTRPLRFPLLLLATAFLGVGFGLTVPALNTLAAAFHPAGVESSVLALNALLGLGTVLAPVFVAIFVGLGFWWGLPVLSAILLVGVVAESLGLPLRTDTFSSPRAASGIPRRFWMYAGFAVPYGVCERSTATGPSWT
jgi:MFS family permease